MCRDACDWCDAPDRSSPCYLSVILPGAGRYCPCVLRIGLTGGIGSGKSTVARLLADRGAHVVDADVLAREVVEPGTPGLAAVAEAFGAGVLTADGALDRPALAAVVFGDADSRTRLDGIVHPLVRARAVEVISALPTDAVVVQDIPLLVETGQAASFDLVLVVEADADARVARLVGRGLTETDARARIAAQATDAQRRAVADVVLDNSGTPEALAEQVERFWAERVVPALRTG
jgi:dephospho-CoA kinase